MINDLISFSTWPDLREKDTGQDWTGRSVGATSHQCQITGVDIFTLIGVPVNLDYFSIRSLVM